MHAELLHRWLSVTYKPKPNKSIQRTALDAPPLMQALCHGEVEMSWLKKLFSGRGSSANPNEIIEQFNSDMAEIRNAGSVDGKHYTDSVERVKQLKREGKNSEAIAILLESVNATEKESKFAGEGWGVAPWYYEQLAILYRKEKQYKNEVEILERYENQPKAPGVGPEKLAARLVKAKELWVKLGR